MENFKEKLESTKPKVFWDYYQLDFVSNPRNSKEFRIKLFDKNTGLDIFSTTPFYEEWELLENDRYKALMEIITRGLEIPQNEKRFFPKRNKEK